MIDFQNGKWNKLRKAPTVSKELEEFLLPDEEVVGHYTSGRDCVTFTNKRVIALNVQGLTGNKRDYTSLPYSKVQAYSVETAGAFDRDSELELYFSSVGKVRFEFSGASDILAIGKIISQFVL